MTMQLQGLRDSLNVKLNAALKILNKTEYSLPDNSTRTTLAKCDNTIDIDGNSVVLVQVEKMTNNHVVVYDLVIRLNNDEYTVSDRVRPNDTEVCQYQTSEPITAGREVVEYVVAKVCYFIGAAYW